jgi:hypothetical protein
MTNKLQRLYGQQYNSQAYNELKDINEKLTKEQDSEEILKLRLQRLYKGIELFHNPTLTNNRGYYPY